MTYNYKVSNNFSSVWIDYNQDKSIHTIHISDLKYEIESKSHYGLSVSLNEDTIMFWQGSNFYFIKDGRINVFSSKILINNIFNFKNKSILQTELGVIFFDCSSETILYEFVDEDVVLEINILDEGVLEIMNFNQKKTMLKFDFSSNLFTIL